jgi:hypothetical protein
MKPSKAQIAALEALAHDEFTHVVLLSISELRITNHRGFIQPLARSTFDVLHRLKLIHDVNTGGRLARDWRISPLGKDALKKAKEEKYL